MNGHKCRVWCAAFRTCRALCGLLYASSFLLIESLFSLTDDHMQVKWSQVVPLCSTSTAVPSPPKPPEATLQPAPPVTHAYHKPQQAQMVAFGHLLMDPIHAPSNRAPHSHVPHRARRVCTWPQVASLSTPGSEESLGDLTSSNASVTRAAHATRSSGSLAAASDVVLARLKKLTVRVPRRILQAEVAFSHSVSRSAPHTLSLIHI